MLVVPARLATAVGAVVGLLVSVLAVGAPVAGAPGPNNINIYAIHTDGTVIPDLYIEMCSTTAPTRTCFYAGGFGDGNYIVQDYVPDTYTFRYVDQTDEFLDGYLTWAYTIDDAEVFDYTAGGTFGQAIQPLRPSSISGTLTDVDGAPLAGVPVVAESGFRSAQRGTAVSDVDGTYEIAGLESGHYTISFNVAGGGARTDLYPEYFDGARTLDDATTHFVPNEHHGVVDAVLDYTPTVSGTVTAEGGAPLDGVTVSVCRTTGGTCDYVVTGADGSYRVSTLPGVKRIRFIKSGHLTEYWDDSSFSGATHVAVANGSTVTGIDATLAIERVISGTVTSLGGVPVIGVQVSVSNQRGPGDPIYGATVHTEGDGSFTADGLGPGEYRVGYYHPEYLLEWWDDASVADDLTLIDLRTAVSATGIDAVLQTAGQISGTVTDAGGAPLHLVRVSGCSLDGCSTIQTGADGSYTIGALAAGEYIVSFDKVGYVTEYFNDGHFFSSNASSVSVELDDDISGINAVLTGPATLTGTVTASGAELDGALVTVCTPTKSCNFTSTAFDGAWELAGLPAMELSVSVDPPTSRPDLAVSLPVSITAVADDTVSGVDVDLGIGGSISGKVTEAGGRGLFASEVIIVACSASLGVCRSAQPLSVPLGEYTVASLPAADDYIVQFEPIYEPTPRSPQWWCGTESEAEARPVSVVADVELVGIDATLRDIGAALPSLPEECAPAGSAIDVPAGGTLAPAVRLGSSS